MAGIVARLDICPICGAMGMDPCVEEGGQTCLDHWGRPADLVPDGADRVAVPKLQLVPAA